jgi:hypothetical protein
MEEEVRDTKLLIAIIMIPFKDKVSFLIRVLIDYVRGGILVCDLSARIQVLSLGFLFLFLYKSNVFPIQ